MVEPEDLLGKADALMARHRAPRAGAGQDADFPVLDEVVQLPAGSGDLLARSQPFLSRADEEHIDALAARIRASLLARLQAEIDVLIEERLNAVVSPLIERTIRDLRGELQLKARDVLGDAIHAAVKQEFERRK